MLQISHGSRGFQLICHGWLPVQFQIGTYSTKQPLYIYNKVDRIYFSRKGCMDTNIIPKSFPFPMSTTDRSTSIASAESVEDQQSPSLRSPPPRPNHLPFSATTENIPKLAQLIWDQFASSAYNKSTPFSSMSTPPAHIHLKPDAKPYARHSPIPVPYNWKAEVKASLDRDVVRGIIKLVVPIGTSVEWCSTMVIIQKKNRSPRRTVDLQHLNSQCLRETHHCQSPFQLACQIPPNTEKTVLDAVDGHHTIELNEESQPLTTFITEWGHYMYLRMPQGFLAAGDAYTHRYDEVMKDIPRKVKCADDTVI